MGKIIKSLFIIAIVATFVVAASKAQFSDTEQNGTVSFDTGTIDIAVNGENPWTTRFTDTLSDMKPGYTGYYNFVVHNVGTNPANLWKSLVIGQCTDIVTSEPECVAENGTWTWNADNHETGTCSGQEKQTCDFSGNVVYDLRVELYDHNPTTGGSPVWWETILEESDNKKLNQFDDEDKELYLGMVPKNWYMKVIQSYHLADSVGNEYQGDKLPFDIKLYAEQLTNEVRLVKKYEADTDVSHHVWSPLTYADFSYKVMDSKLNWSLETKDVPDGAYTLIVWDNSSHSYSWNWSDVGEAVVLKHLTDTGNMTHVGSYDPNADIVNAKVWLVPGTFGTEGSPAGSVPWNATGTYFETGLIDFYDSM